MGLRCFSGQFNLTLNMTQMKKKPIEFILCCCFVGKFVDGRWTVCGSFLSGRVGSRLDTGTLWPAADLADGQTARATRADGQN